MKKIEFIKLDIQNFKGINNLSIDMTKDVQLRGKNGAGKTTVADAIWWVLFGKDSQGRTKFAIRPQDESGNDIHHTDIEVKLLLSVNGEQKLFGRKSSEKWVTKRGTGEQVFQGNETTLTVNESVVKTKEFTEELDLVLNEEDFKLLSNPMHFMNGLDDKQRREVLMELAGDEEEIEEELKQRPEFFELVQEWNTDLNKNKSFATFLDFLKRKSKADKDTLKSIPDQIHALESTLEDVGSAEELNNLLVGYRSEIDRIDQQLNKEVKEPAWIKNHITKANELRNKASVLEKSAYEEHNKKVQEVREARSKVESEISTLKLEQSQKQNEITFKQKELNNANVLREQLLEDYHSTNNRTFVEPEVTTKCHACGQELKDIDPQATIEHARKHFEEQKQKDLEVVVEKGKEQAELINKLEKELEALKLELSAINSNLHRVELSKEGLPSEPAMQDSAEALELKAQADKLLEEVSSYRNTNAVDNTDLIQRKSQYMSMIGDVQKKIGKLEQQEATRSKIEELLKTEEELKRNKIKYEMLINDALDFENEKNRAFERNLSTKFSNIQWRLFENQVNGGFRNVCYPMLEGTPYSDQSTGEKIFTGIDIIKTFQSVKGIETPVIIDNRESLTFDIKLDSQTISMYVDENIDTLTAL